jgi:hypothetical protein
MDCEQARIALEELAESGRAFSGDLEIEAHLADCAECQEWYMQELQAIGALEMLDTLPSPSDFTARVLSRLPDAVSAQPAAPVSPDASRRQRRWADFWNSLKEGLARPAYRRRLVPALAVAASLILVLGLLWSLQGNPALVTPGAATGTSLWVIGGGAVVLGALVVVILFLRRRE